MLMTIKTNRFYSLLNNGLEFISGFGLVVFITRQFTLSESGNWFLFIAIFSLLSALRDALVQSALVKLTAGELVSNSYSPLKTALVVVLFFEACAGMGVFLFSVYVRTSLDKLLLFYSLYSIPNSILRLGVFYLRGQLRIKEIVILNGIQLSTLTLGLTLIVFYFNQLSSMVVVLGLSSLVGVFCLSWLIPFRTIMSANFSMESLRIIWAFGKYAMMREAISASSRISLFFSSSFLNLSQTAILGVSQRFSQIALLPNNAFQSILFPTLVNSVKQHKMAEVKQHIEKSLAQLLALTLPFALVAICFSTHLLEMVSGKNFKAGWGILSVYVLLSTLITPFGTAFGSLVTALGKPAIAFKLVLFNTISNITLSYLLIQNIGLWGAPLSLLLTELVGFIIVALISSRLANISLICIFHRIFNLYIQGFSQLIIQFRNLKNKLTYAR
jgi:O-antigen/teichoic acid export membrane protein